MKTRKKERKEPPVKEGEIFNLKVEGFGSKGDALGKIENFIIFFYPEDAYNKLIEGEVYPVRITAVKNKVAFGVVQ